MNFPRVIDIAWTRACDGLGLPRGTRLAADEASVLLKYVAAEVAGIPGAPVATAACRARQALRPWIETGLASLQHVLADGALASVGRALLDDRFYAGRIVDLTVADLVSEPMAPEVCIDPDPWLGLPAGYAGWHHGVVFCVAPLITHELYPLAVDAGAAARVLGVHGDWLSGARAERVIILEDCERIDVKNLLYRELTLAVLVFTIIHHTVYDLPNFGLDLNGAYFGVVLILFGIFNLVLFAGASHLAYRISALRSERWQKSCASA